jgi:hypothetical protein
VDQGIVQEAGGQETNMSSKLKAQSSKEDHQQSFHLSAFTFQLETFEHLETVGNYVGMGDRGCLDP